MLCSRVFPQIHPNCFFSFLSKRREWRWVGDLPACHRKNLIPLSAKSSFVAATRPPPHPLSPPPFYTSHLLTPPLWHLPPSLSPFLSLSLSLFAFVAGVRELDQRLADGGRRDPSGQATAAQQDARRLEVWPEVVPAAGLPAFHCGLVSQVKSNNTVLVCSGKPSVARHLLGPS